MLRSVRAGAVRHGNRFVHPEGAHAKSRGDGDAAVWVRDVDSRGGALRCAPQRAPQAPPSYHWLPSPTTHQPPYVVCQGPQKDTKREHRDDYAQKKSPFSWGRVAGKT